MSFTFGQLVAHSSTPCSDDSFQPIRYLEHVVDAGDMITNCLIADLEFLSDLAVVKFPSN